MILGEKAVSWMEASMTGSGPTGREIQAQGFRPQADALGWVSRPVGPVGKNGTTFCNNRDEKELVGLAMDQVGADEVGILRDDKPLLGERHHVDAFIWRAIP
jgi:hypothetical protein